MSIALAKQLNKFIVCSKEIEMKTLKTSDFPYETSDEAKALFAQKAKLSRAVQLMVKNILESIMDTDCVDPFTVLQRNKLEPEVAQFVADNPNINIIYDNVTEKYTIKSNKGD